MQYNDCMAQTSKSLHDSTALAEEKLSERKFCVYHRRSVMINEGSYVTKGGKNYWICFGCQDKAKAREKELKKLRKKLNGGSV